MPNLLIIFLDWACYGMLTLTSGFFGINQQATHIVLMNIVAILWGFAYGLQQATCALVGVQIGAGDLKKAKDLYKIICFVMLFFSTFLFVSEYSLRSFMIPIFTDQ